MKTTLSFDYGYTFANGWPTFGDQLPVLFAETAFRIRPWTVRMVSRDGVET